MISLWVLTDYCNKRFTFVSVCLCLRLFVSFPLCSSFFFFLVIYCLVHPEHFFALFVSIIENFHILSCLLVHFLLCCWKKRMITSFSLFMIQARGSIRVTLFSFFLFLRCAGGVCRVLSNGWFFFLNKEIKLIEKSVLADLIPLLQRDFRKNESLCELTKTMNSIYIGIFNLHVILYHVSKSQCSMIVNKVAELQLYETYSFLMLSSMVSLSVNLCIELSKIDADIFCQKYSFFMWNVWSY